MCPYDWSDDVPDDTYAPEHADATGGEGPGGGTPARAGATPPETPSPEPDPADPESDAAPAPADEAPPKPRAPGLSGRRAGGPRPRLVKEDASEGRLLTARERIHMLDLWQRSGLPARDFGALVGISRHTLYAWKKRFADHGPVGLEDGHRGPARGSKLDELTKRTILLMKTAHPEYGCERISHLLLRGPALAASPQAVARFLKESGYVTESIPTRPHEPPVRHFERARPNQLWQTDLFTFMLKRQNSRVCLVAFMDDHSRFVVGYGLHASQSTALTLEVLRAAMSSYGTPEEVLTDNGPQYKTWRGKSAFTKELEKRGIRQIVSRPRHPQTLGKIERFWGTLWRGCVEAAQFRDIADARVRLGHFIDHYNFQRPHLSLDGLVPADRFFGAASEVKRALLARVAKNALEIAQSGSKPPPFYMAGHVGGKGFSVHAEGEQVFMTDQDGRREEVSLVSPAPIAPVTPTAPATPPTPAASPADASAGPLPQPVTPDGSPPVFFPTPGDSAAEPLPGASPLDGHGFFGEEVKS